MKSNETDELDPELKIELALVQLQFIKSQINLLAAKIDMAKAMYGTPQKK